MKYITIDVTAIKENAYKTSDFLPTIQIHDDMDCTEIKVHELEVLDKEGNVVGVFKYKSLRGKVKSRVWFETEYPLRIKEDG